MTTKELALGLEDGEEIRIRRDGFKIVIEVGDKEYCLQSIASRDAVMFAKFDLAGDRIERMRHRKSKEKQPA